jgi:Ca-activated chloride channel family protein
MRTQKLWLVILAFTTFLPAVVSAQGVLIDERENQSSRLPRIWRGPRPAPPTPSPQSYRIKQLAVDVNLKDQVAKVQMSQTFVNTGSRQMEVSFVFPLPYDGAIDRMTFMVDGKEYEAKLLNATEARRIYEGYVRRNQDPALMEWMGTGMFKTSVFPVPAGASRKVSIRYSQLCRKQSGLTEVLFPLSTAKYTSQPIEKVEINVTIQSQAKIKNVYSPTHAVTIKRPNDRLAKISYSAANIIPTADFRLMYDIGNKKVGASVLSYRPQSDQDGYFLMLLSPEIEQPKGQSVQKNIIFVVDRSGSMSGKKIEQAKGALRFVLNNLNEGDLFNIIAYDSTVESFKPELQRYNEGTRKAAIGFVEGIFAGGSTNIDAALGAALGQLSDDSRPNYVVFLTDGLPTTGEKRESQIVENASKRNKGRTRLFSFGLGFDVNSRLLDRLSRSCFGQSQYVRPNEDIEAHVSRLYDRIGSPVMTDLVIKFDMEDLPAEEGKLVNRVYPRDNYDLFMGEQLVVVGRYKTGGDAKITVRGKVGKEKQKMSFPAKFVAKSSDETNAFIEKLWAMRRVGEIIDEIDLHGKNQELIDELVAISTRHGIITPYTSFLADENAAVRDLASSSRQAGIALEALHAASGRAGFVQRELKAQLQRGRLASPAADAGAPGGARGGFGGGGYFGGNASGAGRTAASRPSAGNLLGGIQYRNIDSDEIVNVQTVRNVGGKTFYYRNKRWIDSLTTAKQEKDAIVIKRYSKEYFDLITKHGKSVAKYLALEGNITLVLDGKTYSF